MKEKITSFEQDLFGLKEYSKKLEKFIESEKNLVDGCLVIALTAPYGFGKSTFVSMWQNECKDNDSLNLVRINAWENDYQASPLLVIISSIIESISQKKELNSDDSTIVKIHELLQKDVLKNYLGRGAASIVKQVSKKFTGVDLDKFIEEVEPTTEDNLLEDYQKLQNAISELKELLEEFSSSFSKHTVIIIDELDRSRPDFAINYLEIIKHFFDIKNLTFILSIDLGQLENSAKKMFGRDLNTEEYFRKFFHRKLTLPNITHHDYFKILDNYLDSSTPEGHVNKVSSDFQDGLIGSYLTLTISELMHLKSMTSRQINELARTLSSVYGLQTNREFENNRNKRIATLLMTFFKICQPRLYRDLVQKIADPVEFEKILENPDPIREADDNWSKIAQTQILILFFIVIGGFDRTKLDTYLKKSTIEEEAARFWRSTISRHSLTDDVIINGKPIDTLSKILSDTSDSIDFLMN